MQRNIQEKNIHQKLLYAVNKSNPDIKLIENHLKQGAKQTYCIASTEDYPLHVAAKNGNTALVQLLLEHGGNLAVRNKANYTPMECASRNGHLDCAKKMAEMAKTNADDTYHYDSALIDVVNAGRADVAEALLKGGITHQRWRRDNCNYALHFAVLNDDPKILALLLKYIQNQAEINKDELTPEELAFSQQKGVYFMFLEWAIANLPLEEVRKKVQVRDNSPEKIMSILTKKQADTRMLRSLEWARKVFVLAEKISDLSDAQLHDLFKPFNNKNTKQAVCQQSVYFVFREYLLAKLDQLWRKGKTGQDKVTQVLKVYAIYHPHAEEVLGDFYANGYHIAGCQPKAAIKHYLNAYKRHTSIAEKKVVLAKIRCLDEKIKENKIETDLENNIDLLITTLEADLAFLKAIRLADEQGKYHSAKEKLLKSGEKGNAAAYAMLGGYYYVGVLDEKGRPNAELAIQYNQQALEIVCQKAYHPCLERVNAEAAVKAKMGLVAIAKECQGMEGKVGPQAIHVICTYFDVKTPSDLQALRELNKYPEAEAALKTYDSTKPSLLSSLSSFFSRKSTQLVKHDEKEKEMQVKKIEEIQVKEVEASDFVLMPKPGDATIPVSEFQEDPLTNDFQPSAPPLMDLSPDQCEDGVVTTVQTLRETAYPALHQLLTTPSLQPEEVKVIKPVALKPVIEIKQQVKEEKVKEKQIEEKQIEEEKVPQAQPVAVKVKARQHRPAHLMTFPPIPRGEPGEEPGEKTERGAKKRAYA